MSAHSMTVLAKQRHFLGQQFAVVASMGLMAHETILFHGRMLLHKGTSLLGMALVAEFVQRIRFEHLIRACSDPGAGTVDGLDAKGAHGIVAA